MARKRRRSSKPASSRRVKRSRTEDLKAHTVDTDWLSILANFISIAASVFRIATTIFSDGNFK